MLYCLESLDRFRTVDPDAVTLKNPLSQYCENISDDLLISHTSLRLLDVLGQGIEYCTCCVINLARAGARLQYS